MHQGPETRSARLRSSKLGLTFAVAFALLFAATMVLAPATHATSSYTAIASGDWTSPSTWQGGSAPPTTLDSSDFVTISSGVTVTISSTETVTDNGAPYFVIWGALSVEGSLAVNSALMTNDGALSVSGTVVLGLGTTFNDYGGAINVLGGGTLSNGGSVSLEVPSPLTTYPEVMVFGGGTLDNTAYITVPSGGANLASITNEGTFNNNAGGSVSVSAHLYNYGVFNNAAGTTVTVSDDLENLGTFLNAGGLYIEGGGALNPGTFTNSGTLFIGGSSTSFDSTGPFVNANGGTVDVLTTLSVGPSTADNQAGGTLNVDGGTLVSDGATFTNEGTIVVGPSPGSNFDNHGAFDNNPGASLEVETDGVYVGGYIQTHGAISNQGSFESGGIQNYAGITNSYGGHLTISNTLDYLFNYFGGTLTNNQGGTIVVGVAGGLNNQGTINNYGLISSTGSGSITSASSYFYNYCPTGSVTATIPDNLLPTNEGCTLTFSQNTLPSGQGWGVTVYTLEAATDGNTGALVWVPVGSGAHYSGTQSSIQVSGLNGQGFTYSIDTPITDPPDITFNCAGTVLQPSPGSYSYYSCSISGAAILTGPATIGVNFGESYNIPTTTSIAPGTSSTFASNPNGVTLTVTVADSNNLLPYAPGGSESLSDGGAGGTFGDGYGDGPGSYYPNCLYEVDSYTSQCPFTYYPNPSGTATTVTITATYQGDYAHVGGSFGTATLTVTYYLSCPQVPNQGGANLKGADLQNCELAGYDLSGDNLMGANIASADLTGANLQGANLKGAVLAGDVLDGASFQDSNLMGANLASATGTGVDFRGANLQGADLQGMKCTSCDFSGANLLGSNLSGGVFTSDDFAGSNLSSSDLSYGDFSYANFTGATSSKAVLAGAVFTGATDPP